MNEPWWIPHDDTIRFILTMFWATLKGIGIIYVIYRLESIADAVGANDDEEDVQ